MITRYTHNYHFLADLNTGITLRWGTTMKDNPALAPVPELADISISNHCTKGCSFCYRNSTANNEFMSLEDYCYVLDAMHHPKLGGVFQVAIGGGEPLEHPRFIDIINAKSNKELDVHLMVENPDDYILPMVDAGADIITIHQESCTHIERTIQTIKKSVLNLHKRATYMCCRFVLPFKFIGFRSPFFFY